MSRSHWHGRCGTRRRRHTVRRVPRFQDVVAQRDLLRRLALDHHHPRHLALALVLENHRGQLRQRGVALCDGQVRRFRGCRRRRREAQLVDRKRRETHGVVLPQGVEDVVGARGAIRLGDEQRVVGSVGFPVPLDPHREIRRVEIRRADVDGRRRGFPDVLHLRLGAAAGVRPGRAVRRRHGAPGVHVHGQRVFGLARRRHPVHVTRIVPRHEELIRVRGFAKDLFPGPGCLRPGRFPRLAEQRMQRVLVAADVVQQLLWHGGRESLIGRLAPIPRIAQHAHFVLHLDHDDPAIGVHLLDVPHQGGKSARIGIAVRRAQCGEGLDAFAVLVLDPWEPLLVGFHPGRDVAGDAVLPAPEP